LFVFKSSMILSRIKFDERGSAGSWDIAEVEALVEVIGILFYNFGSCSEFQPAPAV
jgi:hypothetical protein